MANEKQNCWNLCVSSPQSFLYFLYNLPHQISLFSKMALKLQKYIASMYGYVLTEGWIY